MTPDPLITSLLAAAESAPSDVTLRLHLVELLKSRGETVEAIRHCASSLTFDPTNETGLGLMRELLGVETPQAAPAAPEPAPAPTPAPAPAAPAPAPVPRHEAPAPVHAAPVQEDDRSDLEAEQVNVTLADVGGMDVAKERLEAAVLAPMRNPELRRLYRQSRSGGVLLYGPPGCGKNFLARATAGELNARFLSVTFADMTHREQADEIAAVFQAAREQAPVVLCLSGIEALGERSITRRASTTRSVTALAAELDRGPGGNLGVTVMGATSSPWDIDPVLRRPGRLEQTLLVLPPDRTTREVVLRQHLGEDTDVDVAEVARRGAGYSGADLAAAVRMAEVRANPVTTDALIAALEERPPSARLWIDMAARELAVHPDNAAFVGLREYINARDAHGRH